MIDDPAPPRPRPRGGVLAEALVVALIGSALAFMANAISPRGLQVDRDYFPSVTAPLPKPRSDQTAAMDSLATRLQEEGLQPANRALAEKLFHDPRVEQSRVVFVDARNDEEFTAGHIPGAHPFDHFHPETHLTEILPLCQNAEQILVYCTGGDCEDSQAAALYLKSTGIPGTKLFVYTGGITDWTNAGFPTETGALLPAR